MEKFYGSFNYPKKIVYMNYSKFNWFTSKCEFLWDRWFHCWHYNDGDKMFKIFRTVTLWNSKQTWTNLISSCSILRTCNFTCAPNWAFQKWGCKTKVRVQSTKILFSVLYYLSRTSIFIFNVFQWKAFVIRICSFMQPPKCCLNVRCFNKIF